MSNKETITSLLKTISIFLSKIFLVPRIEFHSFYFTKFIFTYFIQLFITASLNKKAFYDSFEFWHLVKNAYGDYYKASKYYHLLKDPLNCLFFVLEKNPQRTDLVETDSIINHCIIVDMDDALVVTSVSNYNEHD